MKNKRATYYLLPLVIGIWAYVIYSFLNPNTKKTNSAYIPLNKEKPIPDTPSNTKDSFELRLSYSDPFFRKFTKNQSIPSVNQKLNQTKLNGSKQTNKSKLVKNDIKWPEIKYFGLITNDNKTIGLLSINHKTYYVEKNNEIESMQVAKLTNDSVLLVYKNDKKYFKR